MNKLDFLIKYLLKENKDINIEKLPQDLNDKKRLYRSLCNIREPIPVSDEYIKIESEYLKEENIKVPQIYYGLETNKLYTLHETVAPGGYTLASDIPFKLNEDGNVVVADLNKDSISEDGGILLKDALTSIRILKVDVDAVTNTPLSGAHIQILDGNKVVQEFDSTEDNAGIQIDGLKTGVVYTLHESSAPNNYTLAADTHFSLNADGTINLEKTNTDFKIDNGSIVLSVKDVQIPKTTYSVQKEWVDNNNALNNRPSTIQVQLQSKLGNGEFTNYGDYGIVDT